MTEPALTDVTSGERHAAWATEDARRRLYRRVLIVVVTSQIFGGAGLAAGVTVGALLAQDMLGGASIAGLPAALFTLGSAVAAYMVGRLSQAAGRRPGLTLGSRLARWMPAES